MYNHVELDTRIAAHLCCTQACIQWQLCTILPGDQQDHLSSGRILFQLSELSLGSNSCMLFVHRWQHLPTTNLAAVAGAGATVEAGKRQLQLTLRRIRSLLSLLQIQVQMMPMMAVPAQQTAVAVVAVETGHRILSWAYLRFHPPCLKASLA